MLSSAALAADEQPVLRWCLDHFPRFHEFHGVNQPIGASVDLMQELAKRVGFRIEYSPQIPLARCFKLIENGEMDLITNLNKTPERAAFMLMFPYSQSIPEAIYQRGDDHRAITQVNQLNRLTVATVRHYTYHPLVMRLIRDHAGKRLMEVDSIASGFETLAKGRVDALIVPRYSSLDYLHHTSRLHQQFKRAPLNLETDPPRFVYIGFSKKSRHPELADAISRTLQQMMTDGTVRRLYAPDAKEVEQLVLVQL